MWAILAVFSIDRSMIRVLSLNGTNFLECKESLLFQLDLMDLDICFQVNVTPTKPIEESNADTKIQYEKWERSNKLSLSFMLQHVPRDIQGPMTSTTLATSYLDDWATVCWI